MSEAWPTWPTWIMPTTTERERKRYSRLVEAALKGEPMALPNGALWPFYVVLSKTDTRLKRHSFRTDAEREARRLAEKEQSSMCVLRLISRFDVAKLPVEQRIAGPDPAPEDMGFMDAQ